MSEGTPPLPPSTRAPRRKRSSGSISRARPSSSATSDCPSSSATRNRPSSSSTSDRPSASANSNHGYNVLDKRLRSVLCDPLGLPLSCAFNNVDPSTLRYLARERRFCPTKEENHLNSIFEEAVNEWNNGSRKKEPDLTKILAKKIAAHFRSVRNRAQETSGQINVQHVFYNALDDVDVKHKLMRPGKIDMIFSEANSKNDQSESTPLAVIEFGLDGTDWWKKLDQGIIYVDYMHTTLQSKPFLQFEKPLILGVVTFHGSQFRIGTFLCSRKSGREGDYQMSLLWHTEANTLDDASRMFGTFLRVAADFQLWRDIQPQLNDGYEHFSSNCCKAVSSNNYEVVLRSYDSRFRKTNRSPEVYLAPECKDIVGNVETIVELLTAGAKEKIVEPPRSDAKVASESNYFWGARDEQALLIIAVPFRHGSHVAKKPGDFIPIIDQLTKLHEQDYVHGDIRAFNTVFGKKGEGYLIDFDFGGKVGSSWYPQGYRRYLDDGVRIGHGDKKANNEILKWHDWYALGQLIFVVHNVHRGGIAPVYSPSYEWQKFWTDIMDVPDVDRINHLKAFLGLPGWTVSPNQRFDVERKRRTEDSQILMKGLLEVHQQ